MSLRITVKQGLITLGASLLIVGAYELGRPAITGFIDGQIHIRPEATNDSIGLETLVLVDDEFLRWFGSLDHKGDHLYQELAILKDSSSLGRRVDMSDYGNGFESVLRDQVAAANWIYSMNQELTSRLGRKLDFHVSSIDTWDYDDVPLDLYPGYDARGLLADLKRETGKSEADLIIAFTGHEIYFSRSAGDGVTVSSRCAGIATEGGRYVLVSPDAFRNTSDKGTVLAHEIGHCLGLGQRSNETSEKRYLMYPGDSRGKTFSAGEVFEIIEHLKEAYPEKF